MASDDSYITFPDVDPATAGRYARELREQLLDASTEESVVRLVREDPEALDAGSVIELVGHLLTPFVAHVVASSVIEWVKWRKTTVRLTNGVFELNVDTRADEQFIEKVIRFLTGNENDQSKERSEKGST